MDDHILWLTRFFFISVQDYVYTLLLIDMNTVEKTFEGGEKSSLRILSFHIVRCSKTLQATRILFWKLHRKCSTMHAG